MRITLLAILSTIIAVGAEPVPLFNGKDMHGWKMVGPGRFVIEDGMLKTEGGMGLLTFPGMKFGNQTIRVVFKTASQNANSGVYIRMPEPAPDPWYGVHNGYEVQIDAGGDDWHCTGAIYSLSKATKRTQKPMGEWNTMDIQLLGPKTIVFLNGEKVNEFTVGQEVPPRKQWFEPARGPRPNYGYIGLQNHDGRSVVYFKEVSVLLPEGGKALSQHDRDFAMSYLHATRKAFLDMTSNLSEEQWKYKPAPDRWSAGEIAEHLTIVENGLWDYALRGMEHPLTEPGAKKQFDDDGFIKIVTDRSKKAQAPEMFRPAGRWTHEEIISEFRERRDAHILFMEKTLNDLRGSLTKGPFGVVDVYQFLLMIPAHTERHLAQMKEVMDSPGFPKK